MFKVIFKLNDVHIKEPSDIAAATRTQLRAPSSKGISDKPQRLQPEIPTVGRNPPQVSQVVKPSRSTATSILMFYALAQPTASRSFNGQGELQAGTQTAWDTHLFCN